MPKEIEMFADHDTLPKAIKAFEKAGLTDTQALDAITQLHNAGIFLREIREKDTENG